MFPGFKWSDYRPPLYNKTKAGYDRFQDCCIVIIVRAAGWQIGMSSVSGSEGPRFKS